MFSVSKSCARTKRSKYGACPSSMEEIGAMGSAGAANHKYEQNTKDGRTTRGRSTISSCAANGSVRTYVGTYVL